MTGIPLTLIECVHVPPTLLSSPSVSVLNPSSDPLAWTRENELNTPEPDAPKITARVVGAEERHDGVHVSRVGEAFLVGGNLDIDDATVVDNGERRGCEQRAHGHGGHEQ